MLFRTNYSLVTNGYVADSMIHNSWITISNAIQPKFWLEAHKNARNNSSETSKISQNNSSSSTLMGTYEIRLKVQIYLDLIHLFKWLMITADDIFVFTV